MACYIILCGVLLSENIPKIQKYIRKLNIKMHTKTFTPYPTGINSSCDLKISKSDPIHQQDKEEETNDSTDQCKKQQH